jgi:hypothetical protein
VGQSAPRIWVFVSKIMGEIILGLDILWPYDTVMHLKHRVLWLGEAEVSLLHTGSWPWVLLHMMISGDIILVVQLKGPLEAANQTCSMRNEQGQDAGLTMTRDNSQEDWTLPGVDALHMSADALPRRLYVKLVLTSKKANGSQTTRRYKLSCCRWAVSSWMMTTCCFECP